MVTPSFIYWMTRLDGINFVFCVVTILLGVCAVLCCLFGAVGFVDGDEDAPVIFKWFFRFFAGTLVSGLLLALTPTTKEMAAIVVVPKIANNETVDKIGDGVKTLAVEWLNELRPKSKKEQK